MTNVQVRFVGFSRFNENSFLANYTPEKNYEVPSEISSLTYLLLLVEFRKRRNKLNEEAQISKSKS